MEMERTYSDLIKLPTFEERFEYLRTNNKVGQDTFGHNRYLNQRFYTSKEWRSFRNQILLRDNGMDLGVEGKPIVGRVYVHHLNELTPEDILNRSWKLFDPENVICCSKLTHDALHFSDASVLPDEYVERTPNDTCPWRIAQ